MNKYKMMYEEQNENIKGLLELLKERLENSEKIENEYFRGKSATLKSVIRYLEIIAD